MLFRSINTIVSEKASELVGEAVACKDSEELLIPAGAVVKHEVFGEGQVVALEASFPDCPTKTIELPYLRSLPDEVSFCPDGKSLLHDRFGEGTVYAYVIVFRKVIMRLSYPTAFKDSLLTIE